MKRTIFLLVIMLFGSNTIFATDKNEIGYYEQARVAVKYKGGVGELIQRISKKLNIGYYALNADPLTKISIEQDRDKTIAHLLELINQQLKKDIVKFELLNDKVILILANKGFDELNAPSYIGDVQFSADSKEQKEVSDDIKFNKEGASQDENNDSSSSELNSGKISSTADMSKVDKKAADKIKSIIEISKDKNLLDKYTKRKSPVYKADNQKDVKLREVKSTKISTFLIFDEGVDLNRYSITGDFQDYAQLGNIAAILHRQKRPPRNINITSDSNNKAVLVLSN